MFYKGLIEREPGNAFIQFYRVLEYYSVMSLQLDLADLRANVTVNNKEFVIQVFEKIQSRDEMAALCRLVSKLSDTAILHRARKAQLIEKAGADHLGNALYEHRNSLVHAKYDYRQPLVVSSIFDDVSGARAREWQRLAKELAAKAVERFGNRIP